MQSIIAYMSANPAVVFWLVTAVALVAVEAATAQMVCIWFAIGAFIAFFTAMAGMPVLVQFMVFAVISLLTLVFTRRFVKGMLHVKKTATNADSVIGLCGSVTESIDNNAEQGRVFVGGLSWAARAEDGQPIPVGVTVVVKAISGVKLIVERQDG